jgi:L-glyceraldehyde 3-phosphate reductase
MMENPETGYVANGDRYTGMHYRRCGRSGIQLPAISLGLWHNFGDITPFETQRAILREAFDCGITHLDLANNYGPEAGAAESNFGLHMKYDFKPYRDELIISTKAGYYMWPGPYGEWGSKKNLVASLDQSLRRMGLDYVDIFYHHRPDPDTPIEETMEALSGIVKQGKALYVGISNYNLEQTRQALATLGELKTPCLIHQANYSMLDRWIEDGLTDLLDEKGTGLIAFKPLEQGLLTGKYLSGIPADSRIALDPRFLTEKDLNENVLSTIKELTAMASERDQSLAQMAISWILRDSKVTSALIGVSRPAQLTENIAALDSLDFSDAEIARIEAVLSPPA